MVLIECKRLPKEEYSKDYDVFFVQLPGATNIGEATEIVQKIQNTRVRLQWMLAAAKQIAKDNCNDDNKHYMLGPVADAERYLALERADKRELTTQEELDKIIETFKGGVMILFPSECSGNDACKRLTAILEDDSQNDVEKSKAHRILSIIDDYATNEKILSGPATMWWSGKPLAADADFTKYVGKTRRPRSR
ncbi:hypothetical protein AGDE_09302 [Angomonas deanei]|nr:hypothetical protein AGDE_09302 [Angomonas deanei]|eukprot:EPY30715.1 hypothetical protein AGDE_09302 [Angomonas deanei]